jgi:hypothetical protein
MMPLTLTLTLIKQAVRHGFKPLSLFFVPSITGLSAQLALIALIATTPFIASGETIYNQKKLDVALPPKPPQTVLLDQQIAMRRATHSNFGLPPLARSQISVFIASESRQSKDFKVFVSTFCRIRWLSFDRLSHRFFDCFSLL